jgi:hypothetical protein
VAKAMKDMLADLKNDNAQAIVARSATFDEFKQITRFNEWVALEDRFNR